MERLEEVVVFEVVECECVMVVVELLSDGVGVVILMLEDVGELEVLVVSVAGSEDVIDASVDVEELNLDFEWCVLLLCEVLMLYDENDYVFDEEDGDDYGMDEYRVVVVSRAFVFDGALF